MKELEIAKIIWNKTDKWKKSGCVIKDLLYDYSNQDCGISGDNGTE